MDEIKRPRGRPRKPTPEEIAEKIAKEETPEKETKRFEFPDNARIEVLGPVKLPSLADPAFDPFNEHKTEPKKFHYRALNTRPHMLRKREAQGYQIVPGAPEYGDLVLARIPKEIKDAREKAKEKKMKSMSRSVKERFVEEAERSGVKTFKE